jgi:hypothetical protein
MGGGDSIMINKERVEIIKKHNEGKPGFIRVVNEQVCGFCKHYSPCLGCFYSDREVEDDDTCEFWEEEEK